MKMPAPSAPALTAIVLSVATMTPAWAQHSSPPDTFVPNRDVVLRVEERLAAQGYPIVPDGNYDAELRNNVIRYQSENGLRPTGNVDLDTIGALGIQLAPAGGTVTALAPPPPLAAEPEMEMEIRMVELAPSWGYPLLRDEHMSSPQVAAQAAPIENSAGLSVPPTDMPSIAELSDGETPPGFPPGFAVQDLY